MSKQERIEAFLKRLERAEALVQEGRVHPVQGVDTLFVVRGGQPYVVDLEGETCTCPDFAKGHICKHFIAAVLVARSRMGKREAPRAA